MASEPEEFKQIFKLNYQTFVSEIPQHTPNAKELLQDKFHSENIYFICLENSAVIGMVAVRSNRPFSLDFKLPKLEQYLSVSERPIEIRLLAIRPDRRHGQILGLLIRAIWNYCLENNFSCALISGRVKNLPLYQKLGFKAFGPLVGTLIAPYQPMYLDKPSINKTLSIFKLNEEDNQVLNSASNFLPGPVSISKSVAQTFVSTAFSHRSEKYSSLLNKIKNQLGQLTHLLQMEILMGTGTLANDVIASQLSLLNQPGLILSNGEFGERLIAHANGFQLQYIKHQIPWGEAYNYKIIDEILGNNPNIKWVWSVHSETSTGMINPLNELKIISQKRNVHICLDCISSIGIIPVDLEGVHFASTVSGKGLGAFTGISIVFYEKIYANSAKLIPQYLNLNLYQSSNGTPFSGSSNLLSALNSALEIKLQKDSFLSLKKQAEWFYSQIIKHGLPLLELPPNQQTSVFTFKIPKNISSYHIGKNMESQNILVSHNSQYLIEKNWIQICLFTEHDQKKLLSLVLAIKRHLSQNNPGDE